MVCKAGILQRAILIHCFLYYVLDTNILSDAEYDDLAIQYSTFVTTMREEDKENTQYWYAFHNFDPCTGYDLYQNLCHADKQRIKNAAYAVRGLKR